MSRKSARNIGKNSPQTHQRAALPSSVLWLMFVALATFGLTVYLYSPALNYGFLEWDDNFNVTGNPDVVGFGLSSMIKMFHTTYVSMYTPLTMMTFGGNYVVAGTQAGFFHLTNLLLHLLCGFAVYVLVRTLTSRIGWSLLAAIIFLIHPLQVESVAWISARSTPLYALFYILALISYVRYLKEGENIRDYAVTGVLFCLSLLSKPSAVSLPLVLLALDYWHGRAFTRKLVWEKAPFFVLATIFAIIAIAARPNTDLVDTISYGVFDRIVLSCYSYLWYLAKFILPLGLSAFVQYPIKNGDHLPWFYYAAISPWVVSLAIAIRYWRRFGTMGPTARTILLGCALFFVPNAMVIVKAFTVLGQLVADRYAYVPYIGLCLIVATVGAQIQTLIEQKGELAIRWVRGVGIAAGLAGVLGLGLLTGDRVAVWATDLSLWNDVLAKDPTIASAYYMRGGAKADRHDNMGALADLNEAIARSPKFAAAYAKRGFIKYTALSDLGGALTDYDNAIEYGMRDFRMYFQRGSVEGSMGRYAQAVEDFDRSVALRSDWPLTYYMRAMAKLGLKKKVDACVDLRRAADGGMSTAHTAFAATCSP